MEILSVIVNTISSIIGFAIGCKISYKVFGQASVLDNITKWVKE